MSEYTITFTKDLVTTISYLIGVEKPRLDQYFDETCHDLLQSLYQNRDATMVRYLCKLRTDLLKNYKKTNEEMRFNLKNLDRLEWFDHDNIKQLQKWDIEIIKVNYSSDKYIVDITEKIALNIGKCACLFPDWVNWEYIKDLFYVPHFKKPDVLKKEFGIFMGNKEFYPFQKYIHWNPSSQGSILYNDKKFLEIIYAQHGDHFTDFTKCRTATDVIKNNIYEFVQDSMRTIIVVDCENSDVYKLLSVLKNLKPDQIEKIERICLYDDYHTTAGWEWLCHFTEIPVEHIDVPRVSDRKSLVDIKMSIGVTKNFYEDGIDSYILLSSDSDYWALISSLPDAKFLVMYEYTKCGNAIKRALEENGTYYCSIDDFCTSKVEDLKRAVLLNLLEKYIPDLFITNGKDLVTQLYEKARITATDTEKDAFFQRYIRTLTLKCSPDGEFAVEIKK